MQKTYEDICNFCVAQGCSETVLLINYDYAPAFAGLTQDGRAVYDHEPMVEFLMNKDDFTEEEAIDWIDYNTVGAIGDMVVIRYPGDEEEEPINEEDRLAIPYEEMRLPEIADDLASSRRERCSNEKH